MKFSVLVKGILFAGLLSCLSPLAFAGSSTETIPPTSNIVVKSKPSFVFVQRAAAARIEPIPNKPQSFKVTLEQLSPDVLYISDRPERKTGSISSEKFIEQWNSGTKNSFSQNEPNAFLHGVLEDSQSGKEKSLDLAVQLSQPQLDSKNNTLSYTISLLTGNNKPLSSTKLYNITLFIDDAPCLSCW